LTDFISPADPEVVYVPQYNPVTIYNTQAAPAAPAPAQTTTGVTQSSRVSTGTAVGIGPLSFGVRPGDWRRHQQQ